MMNKLGLFIVSAVFAFIQTGCAEQSTKMSLNSSNPQIVWEVKPQADLENMTGEQISTPGFAMSDFVKGVVPGTVFTAYVEAGIVPDPNYADNIYKVDETFYNRPFWYRTEFELPASYSEGKRVWLHFDNTNRFADFYFNGEKISGTKTSVKDVSGHMLRSKFDVTDLVKKSGKNAIAVLITDPDQKRRVKLKIRMGLLAVPAIWQVPVGTGCLMYQDVWRVSQVMPIWLLPEM